MIFDGLNLLADRLERRLPRWFQYDGGGGDFVTWIHHALWALLFAGCGALIAWPLGSAEVGAQVGAWLALAFYIVREGEGIIAAWGSPGMLWRGAPHWTGWLIDALMDCVGPALLVWLLV